MSRRHQGRPPHHAQRGPDGARHVTGVSPAANMGVAPNPAAPSGGAPAIQPPGPAPVQAHEALPARRPEPAPVAPANGAGPAFMPHQDGRAVTNAAQPGLAPGMAGQDRNGQCTAPQLRRFIKSRPYVPMHELRRRFGIDGGDDDVTPVRLDPSWVYVGLPNREGLLLGELLRSGEIGYELSLDPRTPIVIGVYPMRPIPRS